MICTKVENLEPVSRTLTHPERRNIVTENHQTFMAMETLKQLEKKLDHLIQLCARLQAENTSLREKESTLLRERSKLLEKNEMARSRVEAMITRLKNLDTEG